MSPTVFRIGNFRFYFFSREEKHGESTFACEVTNISAHGFWLLVEGTEFFAPFEKFPWFRDARISEITAVELHHHHHLYWPKLDVDLSIEIIRNPDNYKLVSK